MAKRLTKKQLKGLFIITLCIIGLVILYFVADHLGWLKIFKSLKELQAYVKGFGAWAPLAFYLIQVLQVIISPIPGNVTALAGGALFGLWPSFLISSLAIITGSIIAFSLARAFGRPLVAKMVGEDITAKYVDTLSSQHKVLLFFMFLLPFFPDDALCLIAGLTGITWPIFIIITVITRPWGLLFSSLVGSGVIQMPMWAWVLIGIGSIAFMTLSYKITPKVEAWLKRRTSRQKHENDTITDVPTNEG